MFRRWGAQATVLVDEVGFVPLDATGTQLLFRFVAVYDVRDRFSLPRLGITALVLGRQPGLPTITAPADGSVETVHPAGAFGDLAQAPGGGPTPAHPGAAIHSGRPARPVPRKHPAQNRVSDRRRARRPTRQRRRKQARLGRRPLRQ